MRKLIENKNKYIGVSKTSKELYNELLPLFKPSYKLGRPSGIFLELISMSFNETTSLNDVEDIIIAANWYISKFKS